jgi:cytochrome c oxidase assembly protein subunit 11
MTSQKSPAEANARLVRKLSVLVLAMFGFGYAMVPLYNTFCQITGLNGKTGRLSEAAAASLKADESRLVTIEFVTNVNAGLPWLFKPDVTRVQVHPGVETQVTFEAMNRSSDRIVGQAIPSVAPNEAARYFSKTECFCFSAQSLAGGEAKHMPVRFVVNPKLPKHIKTLTLGYTFFRATSDVSAAAPPEGLPRS